MSTSVVPVTVSTGAAPGVEVLTATRKFECYYEYPRETFRETAENGNLRVYDPDDEAVWDTLFNKSPHNGDPKGCLVMKEIVRGPDGEIFSEKTIGSGGPCHKNKAREVMLQFRDLIAKGSKTPWDQERHFRDAKEEYERAKTEQSEAQLSLIREALIALTQRPAPGATQNVVSGGSPVSDSSTKAKS